MAIGTFAGLAATGTLQYNGFTFTGAIKIKATVRKVRDDADRTVLYDEVTIRVTGTIAVDGGTDDTLDSIRRLIGEDGGALYFQNKGFSRNFSVNAGGAVNDVKFGPKPKVITWEPIGSNLACVVEWEVVTHVPSCLDARYSGIMAFNYEVGLTYNKFGDATRTVTGHLDIALTRNPNKTVPDSADNYWEFISMDIPTGFERPVRDAHLSLDHSRLDFTIVDVQISSNNPYPNNAIEIRGRHRVRWSRGQKMSTRLRHIITCEIGLKRGINGAFAWGIFTQICSTRLNTILKNDKTMNVLLDDIELDEDIFGYGCNFMAGFTQLTDLGFLLEGGKEGEKKPETFFGDIQQKTGLWTPIGTDWKLWAASIADIQRNSRGSSGITANSIDVIVDLCTASPQLNMPMVNDVNYPQAKPPKISPLQNVTPDPKYSYIEYRPYFEVRGDTPSRKQTYSQDPGADASPDELDIQKDDTKIQFKPSSGTDDVVSYAGRTSYEIDFCGVATRAGFPIPRPSIVSAGNRQVAERDIQFRCGQITNLFGVAIYAATWRINYLLTGSPGGLNPPSIESL